MIDVKNLTIQYPNKKGVFNLDFSVSKGKIVGYLGPNGAGKTTTIRGLLGFMKANSGRCTIDNFDCFDDAVKIQKNLGYIPGEINFIENTNGDEYLKFIGAMRHLKSTKRMNELLKMFEFSPNGSIKRFSKGMKQKLGIISAFMHEPDILILDEPTSGLDPLMQNRFIDLILEEKAKGKTILMSSHMFEEIEKTCDDVLIIKDGRIVAKSDIVSLKNTQRKGFVIQTNDVQQAMVLLNHYNFKTVLTESGDIEVFVVGDNIDLFVKVLAHIPLKGLDVKHQSLEDIFMHFYTKEGN